MNKLKIIIMSTLLILTAGCSKAKLKPIEVMPPDNKINVIDNRSATDKQTYRSSVVSPIIVLGEDIFDVSPVVYLKRYLYEFKPSGVDKITFEIEEFKIADFFPVRMNTTIQAGLTGSLSSLGIIYYGSSKVKEEDSILCSLKGRLNDKPIESSSQVPYKLNPFGFSVRGQEAWLNAVTEAIKQCAKGAYN